jgi:PadR family transcriptional regulator, regulatory protein PadR
MARSRTPSRQAVSVLAALADEPARWRYGYELATEVGLKSGSLYPILVRLADRGLLESRWEQAPPGKPPRHLYRITPVGVTELATLAAEHAAAEVRPRSPAPRRQWREA